MNEKKYPILKVKHPIVSLILMLLVANFANTKWCKKAEKWLQPWHMGTDLRVLSERYLMGTKITASLQMVFKEYSQNWLYCYQNVFKRRQFANFFKLANVTKLSPLEAVNII